MNFNKSIVPYIFYLFIFFSTNYSAQEKASNADSLNQKKNSSIESIISKEEFKSNFFHLSSSPFGIVLYTLPVTVYYEKVFHVKNFNNLFHPFINLGGGGILYWGGSDKFIMARGGFFTGRRKNHFEASLGAVTLLSEGLFPSGSIGYRRQKPNKNFIFRTGIGFPEILYLGLAVGF